MESTFQTYFGHFTLRKETINREHWKKLR
jgi:hypothetical protein